MMRESDRSYLETFGARVTALTDSMGSIERAAQAIGMPASTLSRLRRGANWPTGPQIVALAKGLGVSADYLFGLTDDDQIPLKTFSQGEALSSAPRPTCAAASRRRALSFPQQEPAVPEPESRSHFVIAWVVGVGLIELAIAVAAFFFLR